jgi:hypothetical protein
MKVLRRALLLILYLAQIASFCCIRFWTSHSTQESIAITLNNQLANVQAWSFLLILVWCAVCLKTEAILTRAALIGTVLIFAPLALLKF